MADREGELSAVQRVEMEVLHALGAEDPHHVDGYRRADQLPRHGVAVLDASEPLIEPLRDLHIGELRHLEKRLVVGYRQDPGDNLALDAFGRAPVAEAEEGLDVKEELGDGLVGARIELCLEVVEIRLGRDGLRMDLRIGSDIDLKVRYLLQELHEINRVHLGLHGRIREISAERNDIPDAVVPVVLGDFPELVLRRAYAGEVRVRGDAGLGLDVLHHLMGPVTGARVRAVSD